MNRKALVCILGLALSASALASQAVADDRQDAAAWDKTLHDVCFAGATKNGNSASLSEQYCSCVVAELDKLPLSQRQALTATSPELAAAGGLCKARVGR